MQESIRGITARSKNFTKNSNEKEKKKEKTEGIKVEKY